VRPALADFVLVLHAAYVLFVVGGLLLIWIGYALRWQWVRLRWLRIAHLCAIVLVAVEAVIGMACPLTLLEDALRAQPSERGFVQRWLHAVLFWDWPVWVFTVLYVAFAAMVAATYVLLPPRQCNPSPT
jgi:hypothetical protein